MKKGLVIAGAIVFFLILTGLLAYKILAPGTDTASSGGSVALPIATQAIGASETDPATFTRSFYEWYLENFARDPLFPHAENRNEVLSPWLTAEFLNDWDETVFESEVNPVLLTADDPATWGTGISIQALSQSVRSRQFYVTIGSGSTAHAYTVTVVKSQDGSWKISSIASAA